MIPSNLSEDHRASRDALVPSDSTAGTLLALGQMETYTTLEDIVLPHPQFPCFSSLALLRDITTPEKDATLVSQEPLDLQLFGRSAPVQMTSPLLEKEFSDSDELEVLASPVSAGRQLSHDRHSRSHTQYPSGYGFPRNCWY